jgi:hypothetical protein
MNDPNFDQLEEQYRELKVRFQKGEINQERFTDAVHQLRLQDSEGSWWTIQPETGRFLKFEEGAWISANPTSLKRSPGSSVRSAPPKKKTSKSGGCLTSTLAVGLMSFGSAGVWLIYSNIRAGREVWDLVTPLIMGGVPFLLRLYQQKIDDALKPLYQVTTQFPFAMRTGAAFALPVVLGLVTSTMNSYGYGALRLTTLVSILGSYILTRKVG